MKSAVRILYFLFCLLWIITSVSSQNIYVDASNNTGIEDGTELHPFNTIKEGINAASPGATVSIRQGVYVPDDSWSGNDHTLFLKPGVKIIGESRENTIIEGIIVDQEASNLALGVENLSFEEFHFTRATVEGPFPEQNIIRSCATSLISLSNGGGIPINDTTPGPNHGFLIDNNDLGTDGIIEFKHGDGASEITVYHNNCGYIELKCGSGYTFEINYNDVQYGIIDHSGANNTVIAENQVFDGAIIDKSQGNPPPWGSDQRIERNIITCSENSPVLEDELNKAGIITNSFSVYIGLNTITSTGYVSGISVSSGTPTYVIGNTINLDEFTQPNQEQSAIGIYNRAGWGQVSWNKIDGGLIGYYSSAASQEFSYNEVKRSFTGFICRGAERVFNNKIEDCYGDGMILTGLKGPVFANKILNNGGTGIRVINTDIDLGGGADSCQGTNVIMGNGNFDLYLEYQGGQPDTLYAKYNVWDHTNPDEIMQYDIRDGSDSTGLAVVEFLPVSQLGIGDKEKGRGGEVEIWPNPVKGDMVTICSEAGIREVVIYSLVGQDILSRKFDDEQEARIYIGWLNNGIYCLMSISSDSAVNMGKLMILR